MRTKRLNRKNGFIQILTERNGLNEVDQQLLRQLPTDQLRLMVTREDEEEIVELEMVEG